MVTTQMKPYKEILISLLVIAVIILFPHSGIIPIPFGYCIPVLLLVWVYLKYTKEGFQGIGFSFKEAGLKSFLTGSIAGILLFAFLQWCFFPLLEKIVILTPANLDDFKFIRGNTGGYIFILVMGWVAGGLYEELVFHGFIFTRIEKIVNAEYALPVSFILTNMIFALYHFQLGTSGVINAFMAGSAYHALMIFYKRNIWYAIFCHAIFDTIALTFIYAGYW